jgi:hypothetical protein
MSGNSFVDDCPECNENTCINNVGTRPPYHNLECWSCGWFSIAKQGIMTDEDKAELKETMTGEEE